MTFEEFCKKELNYQTKTTFWEDFSIADRFGLVAIKDTFEIAMKSWKNNVEYLTELVLVLKHKGWFWSEKSSDKADLYFDLYFDLFCEADSYAQYHLQDKDLEYYNSVLD